ncbi:MAG: glycosyltransferase family 2 protein [Paracoccaceae bacterium]
MMRFALIVPTLNATREADAFLAGLKSQTRQPDRFIVIDSSSDDDTGARFEAAGAEVIEIPRAEFDHGGTRMRAARMAAKDCEIVVFMTQDAVLDSDRALADILATFDDPKIASAYGRQLPHHGAKAIESFSRAFSYPAISVRRTKADVPTYGFRTSFCSNSFSAFRVASLIEVGGFPENTIFGEDAISVAELILAGHAHAYVAQAAVRHSHSYTLVQEFRRFFDVGVMHAHNAQLIENFGSPSGAGKAFVLGELHYLARHAPLRIPEAIVRTFVKYFAYKIGRREHKLSLAWKRRLSMHKRFWEA